MNDRDLELDEILAPLRQKRPTAEQMENWKKVRPLSKRSTVRTIMLRALQLGVAVMVGFVIGLHFREKRPSSSSTLAANFDTHATIERIYTKNR